MLTRVFPLFPDKNGMGQVGADPRSFEDILKEKLDKQARPEETPRPFAKTIEAQGLWEKLSHLAPHKIPPRVLNIYPQAKVKPQPKAQPVRWRPQGLPQDVTLAFEFFHSHGEIQVTDQSSSKELKSAFRRLAKSLHPDRHAQKSEFEQRLQAQIFRQLQAHYACLDRFLLHKAA